MTDQDCGPLDASALTTDELRELLREREQAEQEEYAREYRAKQQAARDRRLAGLAAQVRTVLPDVTDDQLAELRAIHWDWAMEEMG